MPTFSFTDGYLLLNAVNMSPMASKLILKTSAAELDNTAFGATYHSRIGGLKDGAIDVTFNQDFAAAQTDALLFPLLGTVVAFEIRPTSAARSVTNPAYTGNVLISAYDPLDGKVGDLAVNSVAWKTSGTINRLTA
jgi:hypothetical protein